MITFMQLVNLLSGKQLAYNCQITNQIFTHMDSVISVRERLYTIYIRDELRS